MRARTSDQDACRWGAGLGLPWPLRRDCQAGPAGGRWGGGRVPAAWEAGGWAQAGRKPQVGPWARDALEANSERLAEAGIQGPLWRVQL